VYSTYLGGRGGDTALDLVTDKDGRLLITGITGSPDFPVKDAWQPETRDFNGGITDAYLCKLDENGQLVFSTYFGGSLVDAGYCLATAPSGEVYLAGATNSPDFPRLPGADGALAGSFDAFLARFTPDGIPTLVQTFGGSRFDGVYDIAVSPSGRIGVAGVTLSPDYPVVNPMQGTLVGDAAEFATVVDANASQALFSTYLGLYRVTFHHRVVWANDETLLLNGAEVDPLLPVSVNRGIALTSIQPFEGGPLRVSPPLLAFRSVRSKRVTRVIQLKNGSRGLIRARCAIKGSAFRLRGKPEFSLGPYGGLSLVVECSNSSRDVAGTLLVQVEGTGAVLAAVPLRAGSKSAFPDPSPSSEKDAPDAPAGSQ
jgi:hypothetical protein